MYPTFTLTNAFVRNAGYCARASSGASVCVTSSGGVRSAAASCWADTTVPVQHSSADTAGEIHERIGPTLNAPSAPPSEPLCVARP